MGDPRRVGEALGVNPDSTMVEVECDRCEQNYPLPQAVYKLCTALYKAWSSSGETPPDGMGYCEPCGEIWRTEQSAAATERYYTAKELYAEMNHLAKNGARPEQIERFIGGLPQWFLSENHEAIRALCRSAASKTGGSFE